MADNGWPETPGVPLHPERDSEGHVIRLSDFGLIDIYRWDAADRLFKDDRDRWIAPADIAADGDEYLGRIITPTERAAAVREAVLAERGEIVALIDKARERFSERSVKLQDDGKKLLARDMETTACALAGTARAILSRTTEDPGHA